MSGQHVTFTNRDGIELRGILDRPAGSARATALLTHCFTCSKDLKASRWIADALLAQGVAVLRFDFTGLGQSGGEFAESSFSTNVSDVVDAARWLASDGGGPDLLLGHSLGGTAILAAAAEIPAARAVITIASPASPEHVRGLLKDAEESIRETGHAEVELGGRPFRIRSQFLDDLSRHDLAADVAALRRPLLVLHAPLDTVVDIDNASELFLAARHPKSFISLDDADHLLTREHDARYVGAVAAAWAERYLPQKGQAEEKHSSRGDSDQVTAVTEAGGFHTRIDAAGHPLVADEPASHGGTGEGPTPYDLLGAALASCTSMTLQMYARRKGIDLRTATVSVRHAKIHAKDCEDCESRDGKIDEFVRDIRLHGDFTDAERERMLEIADRCPVHRTLHGEVSVRDVSGGRAAG